MSIALPLCMFLQPCMLKVFYNIYLSSRQKKKKCSSRYQLSSWSPLDPNKFHQIESNFRWWRVRRKKCQVSVSVMVEATTARLGGDSGHIWCWWRRPDLVVMSAANCVRCVVYGFTRFGFSVSIVFNQKWKTMILLFTGSKSGFLVFIKVFILRNEFGFQIFSIGYILCVMCVFCIICLWICV